MLDSLHCNLWTSHAQPLLRGTLIVNAISGRFHIETFGKGFPPCWQREGEPVGTGVACRSTGAVPPHP